MNLAYHPIDLKLKHPFRISRSVAKVKRNVIVQINDGIGEAAPSEYYNENAETVIESLEKVKDELGDDSFRASLSFDTESSLDPEVSGPKGRTKCRTSPFK